MIYIVPTKKGFGVEIWGTYDDLSNLYEVLGKFWNDENGLAKGAENRDKLISGFSYEISKAKEGSRLKENRAIYHLINKNILEHKFLGYIFYSL